MSRVVSDFFLNDFDAHVAGMLRAGMSAGRPSYLTFNLFNVDLDLAAGFVTVEDELDPDRAETIPLADLARLVERHVPAPPASESP